MKNKVVITGVGVSGSDYANRKDFLDFLNSNAASVPKSPYSVFKNKKIRKMLTKSEKFFCSAAIEAVTDSNILQSDIAKERRGIFLGTTKESSSREELLEVLSSIYDGNISYRDFPKAVSDNMSPLFVVKSLPNACLHYAAEEFEIRGANTLFTTNGVASAQSITLAVETIGRGELEWALAGGFDAHMDEGEFYSFRQYGMVPDKQREDQGKVLGEGAGCILLENYNHAYERRANIYGEIMGYSDTFFNKNDESEESEEDLKNAILIALHRAGLKNEEIDVICIDGALEYERIENEVIKQLFSGKAVVNDKKVISNFIGAATVIEIIFNLLVKDVELNNENEFTTYMKISYGFGGEVSVIIFRRVNR